MFLSSPGHCSQWCKARGPAETKRSSEEQRQWNRGSGLSLGLFLSVWLVWSEVASILRRPSGAGSTRPRGRVMSGTCP